MMLSDEEFQQITSLFNEVFEKNVTAEHFRQLYTNNPLGYSYHSMMQVDGVITGLNSYNLAYYMVGDTKLVFANSVTSMIAKKHRDFFNFFDILTKAYEVMEADGVSFVFGYPNDNSYPVLKKSKLMKEIGRMDTYCLPIRIGGIKPSLKCLNIFSMVFSWLSIYAQRLFSSSSIQNKYIHKEEESFNQTRYKDASVGYQTVQKDGVWFSYTNQVYEGIRTTFLIDVLPKSTQNFNTAVKYIYQHHSKDTDLILYVGYIKWFGSGLIKIPRKYEPKRFNFMGKALDKKSLPKSIWNAEYWDTNLSNYDLI